MGSHEEPQHEVSWQTSFFTMLSYSILIATGHLRDFLGSLTGYTRYSDKTKKPGYGILFKSWESFYTRRLYHRLQDCWNRPINSAPASHIDVMERVSTDNNCTLKTTGKTTPCINLGSYNYLGFADDWKISCRNEVMRAMESWPSSTCSPRSDMGTTALHDEVEKTVARYIGKEAAVVFAMGYDTNASAIPSLMGEGTLLISDALNHTSLVNGARASPCHIRVFRHNDPASLEEILREAITHGQPKFRRPWKKIVVMVEGIYSMEGDICKLKEIVQICKKYKAYTYVDEAHSIGALGKTGRGICEYAGVDPNDIDILMGTFTKSFSAMGGYIAASQEIVDYIRSNSAGLLYHNAMSPIICQQIITAFKVIMGEDNTSIGRNKIERLRENANYFRKEMVRIGFHVYGDNDSPIIPVLLYMPAKLAAFSRECLKRGLAVVVVGFPACSVWLGRSRFCLSAGHTREDLEKAVKVIEELADLMNLRYAKAPLG